MQCVRACMRACMRASAHVRMRSPVHRIWPRAEQCFVVVRMKLVDVHVLNMPPLLPEYQVCVGFKDVAPLLC